MFPSARARLPYRPLLHPRGSLPRRFLTQTTHDPIPANDPNTRKPVPNVSATNAAPTSAKGAQDPPLQELPKEAEEGRVTQAPNREVVWSRSQQQRSKAMSGPRFEQTIMEMQVCALDFRISNTVEETFVDIDVRN
ncbi:MAG: hypothetical protein M1824_000246 [Vezdaea acicularis]|nr:MAG: hypothetical protein M1824_000246 [Vezdaea acicularis]